MPRRAHMASSSLRDDLFPGRSEMAGLMRAKEWSTTSLGAIDTWPQSLRTIVRVLLTSRFAMWMGWGAELTFFYNDAYGAMSLGAKHPWALGRPVPRGLGGNLAGDRATDRAGVANRRGDVGRGSAVVPPTERVSRGDVPHLLLQPRHRRSWRRQRPALRGHRADRAGDCRAPDGPAPGHRRQHRWHQHGARAFRRRSKDARRGSTRSAVHADVSLRRVRRPRTTGMRHEHRAESSRSGHRDRRRCA